MFHQGLSRGGLGHIAVAGGTGDSGPHVRGVLKLHGSLFRKSVHSLPGNLATIVGVGDDLLDFRLFRADLGMAQHAFLNGGNGGGRAGVRGAVTIQARESERDMQLMRIRDGLFRRVRDPDAGECQYD